MNIISMGQKEPNRGIAILNGIAADYPVMDAEIRIYVAESTNDAPTMQKTWFPYLVDITPYAGMWTDIMLKMSTGLRAQKPTLWWATGRVMHSCDITHYSEILW